MGMWDWLGEEKTERVLKLVGGGIAAIVVAGWAVFRYADSKPNDEHVSSPRSVFTNYQVCAGENERHCAAHNRFIGCTDIEKWASNTCSKHSSKVMSRLDGGLCGYTIVSLDCLQMVGR